MMSLVERIVARGPTCGKPAARANRAERGNATVLEFFMTAPAPDPRPSPEPFPHPDPKPASPEETPVTIVDLPPNQPSPGVPADIPLPS
jgi:hypothetical protein